MANRVVCSSPIRIALNYMTVYLQFGRTPLMWASFAGHVECVQLLLDKGVLIRTVVLPVDMAL